MTANNSILVTVSPFYEGRGWTDIPTGINFTPSRIVQPVRISTDRDLSGIRNAVRLGHLMHLEGELSPLSELDQKSLSPEMMTKEQFDTLVNRLKEEGAGDDKAIGDLQKKVTELEGAVSNKDNQIKALNDTVSSLEGTVDSLEEQIRNLEEQLANPPAGDEGAGVMAMSLEDPYEGKTNADLKAMLKEKGIKYRENDNRATLIAALENQA